ncbi:hypothetical protein KCP74_20395 [Salmonella enterica subsp. enterica]|nr:hypothetical protein KCP74_20395 [Salmonella enterica subsp. enterica]
MAANARHYWEIRHKTTDSLSCRVDCFHFSPHPLNARRRNVLSHCACYLTTTAVMFVCSGWLLQPSTQQRITHGIVRLLSGLALS